jgi:hypothetical protein
MPQSLTSPSKGNCDAQPTAKAKGATTVPEFTMTKLRRDRNILKLVKVDTSKLSPADIMHGAELMRRVTACDMISGAGKRRGPAMEAWQEFRREKNV